MSLYQYFIIRKNYIHICNKVTKYFYTHNNKILYTNFKLSYLFLHMEEKKDKTIIINNYEKMIAKLINIIEQKNKLNFEFNLIKEKISEYEALNLIYLNEFDKIKSEQNILIIIYNML